MSAQQPTVSITGAPPLPTDTPSLISMLKASLARERAAQQTQHPTVRPIDDPKPKSYEVFRVACNLAGEWLAEHRSEYSDETARAIERRLQRACDLINEHAVKQVLGSDTYTVNGYTVTLKTCGCPDWYLGQAPVIGKHHRCKHIMAVTLLLRAMQDVDAAIAEAHRPPEPPAVPPANQPETPRPYHWDPRQLAQDRAIVESAQAYASSRR